MAYWAACRMQPNRTALALHVLNLQRYEVYCPRLRDLRVRRGRRAEVLVPLFPGYTFLRVVTAWWQARWAPGICGLVMDGATPAKVPDAVLRRSDRASAKARSSCHRAYVQAIGYVSCAVRFGIS
jgi:transcription antitermination factor NusG